MLKAISRGKPARARGPAPHLADAEVITMEIVGESLGIDCDKHIWGYFDSHWRNLFPALGDRTSFVRQAANLCYWKQRLLGALAELLEAFRDDVHMIDGFPMPVCGFKRAHFANVFEGDAAYGHCASKGETYYGFKGHLVISSAGVVSGFQIAAANVDERDIAPEITQAIAGVLLGDKGYIRPELDHELARRDLYLETPVRSNMEEFRPDSYLRLLGKTRRLVETVIGQLSERFNIEKVRARDLWHLSSRVARKLLAHTISVLLNCERGVPPLHIEGLVM